MGAPVRSGHFLLDCATGASICMLTIIWSVKGGSGASVVAAAVALAASARSSTVTDVAQPDATDSATTLTWLVDLCGDQPAVLGTARPTGPGVADWLAEPSRELATFRRLSVPVVDGLQLVNAGNAPLCSVHAGEPLVDALRSLPGNVVVDAGHRTPCTAALTDALLSAADQSVLVVRPCYLALRAAVLHDPRPHGVVVIEEPGRALTSRDVADVVGVPVLATVPYDASIARAVDAGVLARRPPTLLTRPLEGLT
ncbi:MAG: hypothetical protein ACKOYM_01250 [Actinomycetes bacterium]